MALGIEMNNRMKRKAAAMGVFLNAETQKKFLKMASNVEMQGKVEEEKKVADNLYRRHQRAVEDKCRQDTDIRKRIVESSQLLCTHLNEKRELEREIDRQQKLIEDVSSSSAAEVLLRQSKEIEDLKNEVTGLLFMCDKAANSD